MLEKFSDKARPNTITTRTDRSFQGRSLGIAFNPQFNEQTDLDA